VPVNFNKKYPRRYCGIKANLFGRGTLRKDETTYVRYWCKFCKKTTPIVYDKEGILIPKISTRANGLYDIKCPKCTDKLIRTRKRPSGCSIYQFWRCRNCNVNYKSNIPKNENSSDEIVLMKPRELNGLTALNDCVINAVNQYLKSCQKVSKNERK
jgi:hypothetical protein